MIDKISSICDHVREAMEDNAEKFLYAILTTYVRKTPADLEAMLMRIRDLKVASGRDAAEMALRYIIVFVDVNLLFDVALGKSEYSQWQYVKNTDDSNTYLMKTTCQLITGIIFCNLDSRPPRLIM